MVYVRFTGVKEASQLLASHANSAHIVVLIDLNKFWGFHLTIYPSPSLHNWNFSTLIWIVEIFPAMPSSNIAVAGIPE